MTNISKPPQVLAQSEQLNASPLNSAQQGTQRKDPIVIAMAFGQEVTLTGAMLGLPPLSNAQAAEGVLTLLAPLPSGVVITGLQSKGEAQVLTIQDLLDGKVKVSITETDVIIDLNLSLDDGVNPPLELAVQITTAQEGQNQPPQPASSDATPAQHSPQQSAAPEPIYQQDPAETAAIPYVITNPGEDNEIDLTGDATSYVINAGAGSDEIKPGSGDDIINGGLGVVPPVKPLIISTTPSSFSESASVHQKHPPE